jgi:hypothetical protein
LKLRRERKRFEEIPEADLKTFLEWEDELDTWTG